MARRRPRSLGERRRESEQRKLRRRRRRPPPLAGWLVGELASIAGVTPRAVRFYVARRLLPPPEFRGISTRYGREHLLRLLAIQTLQRTERLDLDRIRRRLDSMSPADLERYAPATGPGASTAPRIESVPTGGLRAPSAATYVAERWDRLVLLPGLELLVRAEASPLVRRVAQEIHDHCAGASAHAAATERAPSEPATAAAAAQPLPSSSPTPA